MAQLCDSNGISIKPENETNAVDWSDELDHVPLVNRRKILMQRKPNSCSAENNILSQTNVVHVKKEADQCESQGLSSFPSASPLNKEIDQQSVQLQNHENEASLGIDSVVACSISAADNCSDLGDSDSDRSNLNRNFCSDQSSLGGSLNGSIGTDVKVLKLKSNISSDFADDLDHIVLKERLRMLLQRKMLIGTPILEDTPSELNLCDTPDNEPASTSTMSGSTLLNSVKVKGEPLDDNELHDPGVNAIGNLSFNVLPVKSDLDFPDHNRDNVDHMQLRDRIKLQTSREDSNLNTSGNFECLKKVSPSVEKGTTVTEASIPVRINGPRKRKKTATDSIETAMEEDAPGLLQVLIEKGVSVDEIKLYGETDNDEPIDESFIQDGFAELEAVISKIFFQRNSLLKLAPIRSMKGSKPSYCLACLFSLVEQTRYLQFRNWPAEWGWCRDLQSFIFVFERHKRIVLERPEYGYATYFFELVDSLSIDWQIKRLVTAMKLTNCGRITLIENRTLLVGEDLTEGEAQVLTQYGWTPNSGIGTMLNYRDRVVHDRKNENDSSEWRSKIGKLLMDGYNGGSIVSSIVEAKAIQCGAGESPQIKMEL